MRLTERQVGATTIIDVSGSITQEDAESLRARLTEMLERGRKQIVLDLAELTHLDSSALGGLVASQIRADKAGTTLKLANAGKRLHDLLVVTRLITVFESYDSVPAAVASFTDRR